MKAHPFALKVVFVALIASLSASLQVFTEYFIYQYSALLMEVWRLWTGHWVHVGWIHYFLNIFAFLCLPFIFPHASLRVFIYLMVLIPPLISLAFFFCIPSIDVYAGLSGVLHAYYMACAILHLPYPKEKLFAITVIAIILLKIGWEHFVQNSDKVEGIAAPALVEAHSLGALYGVIFGVLFVFQMKWKKTAN